MTDRVEIDDACIGGEHTGGKVGRAPQEKHLSSRLYKPIGKENHNA